MFLSQFKNKPVIIAEIGVNHNGCFNLARQMIEAAAQAGADLVKMQTFTADECASRFSPKADYQQLQAAKNQFELLKQLELPLEKFAELKAYAEQLGLTFLSTPDGSKSLQCLLDLKPAAIKVASGEITNLPFLQQIAASGLPVIISTGMSTIGETEKAIDCLQSNGCPELMLLHCTSQYPAPAPDINLKAMQTMQQAFNLPVGFSDHSMGYEAAIAATALGAQIIEKHFTLDRSLTGPDHAASLEPEELKALVTSLRKTATMLGNGLKVPATCEAGNRQTVRRSLVAARQISAGETLKPAMLTCKRPGTGIAPEMLAYVVNRLVLTDISIDTPISWNQLGPIKQDDC
jgi:N-acetylneuraminate synthase